MSGRMKGVGESGDFLVPPSSDETVARLGEVAALRQVTDQLDRVARATEKLSEKVADMHTDVALMKQQSERIADHEARLKSIEDWKAEMRGIAGGLRVFKEWLPALVTLVIAVVMLIKMGALKL